MGILMNGTRSITPNQHALLVPFSIPLHKPISVGGTTIHTRDGISLGLHRSGSTGWGEIAPLPGLHTETLEVAKAAINEALPQLQACLEADSLLDSWRIAATISTHAMLPPSCRFGLTMALAYWWQDHTGTSWTTPFIKEQVENIGVQALAWGTPTELHTRIQEACQQGYTRIKIKVARLTTQEEIALLQSACKALPEGIMLRLDANRGWSTEEATKVWQGIKHLPIEWIEEPLQHPQELPSFSRQTTCPFAIDESLHDDTLPTECKRELLTTCAAIVAKPHALGDWFDVMEWSQHNKPFVISSTFESALGLGFLAEWASLFPSPRVAGLDTQGWLQDSSIEPLVEGGQISLQHANKQYKTRTKTFPTWDTTSVVQRTPHAPKGEVRQ